MKSLQSEIKFPWPVIALALVNVIFHIVFHGKLEFHRDELLYFALGLHPAFGYASIPPLTAWVATSFQTVFGFSLFAVKLYPALLSGLLILLGARITKELGGKQYAQILIAIGILLMPSMIRTYHLFQPVCTDVFLWTLTYYFTIRYVNSKDSKYLLLIGFAGGVGLMNKYMILLLLLSLLIALLLTKHRTIYTKQKFYLGLLLCSVVFAPNLIWQMVQGMPVFDHMAELNERQLVNVDRINILKDQVFNSFASFYMVILGLIFLLRSDKYRYIVISVVIAFGVLLILKGKSYYALGMMPVLAAAGSVSVEEFIQSKILRWLIPILMLLITLPIFPLGLPIYGQDGMVSYFNDLEEDYDLILGRRFEDGTIHSLPQDYADQLGWEELTKQTALAYEKISDKSKALIYASNYGQAGAIAVIGRKYKLPPPVSFNDSFYYWVPRRFEPDIEYFIYINDNLGEDVEALFEKVELVGGITNENAREYGTNVYLCSQPRRSFNEFWQEVLQRVEE